MQLAVLPRLVGQSNPQGQEEPKRTYMEASQCLLSSMELLHTLARDEYKFWCLAGAKRLQATARVPDDTSARRRSPVDI
ncbi:hypothetical protein EJB05_08779, partial [Eragrostis curvula]